MADRRWTAHDDLCPVQPEEDAVAKNPFIDDPRDVMKRHVEMAVASPLEEVRAIHIQTAEHYAAIARDSGLPLDPAKDTPKR